MTESTRWRQVTVCCHRTGVMAAGWIPASAAEREGDLLDSYGEAFQVMTVYPSVSVPDNRLPRWWAAKPWMDRHDDEGHDDE